MILRLAEAAVPSFEEARDCLNFIKEGIPTLYGLEESEEEYPEIAAEFAKVFYTALLVLDCYLTESFVGRELPALRTALFFFSPHEEWKHVISTEDGEDYLVVKWDSAEVQIFTQSDKIFARWCRINPGSAELS